jgi:succinoglycan biosynthesis protein ExoA
LLEKIHVTALCACRNERAHIGALLDSLARQDRTKLSLDVIIADGMSTDGTRDILDAFAREQPWFRVIPNAGRIVSTGLNAAIKMSTAEYIVRLDAHTTYAPDYVRRSIEVIRETAAQNVGGPQRSRASGYWQRAIHAGFHSPFASGGAHFRDDHYCGEVDTVPYGCWRREYLLSIGLFDENLVRNQDDELNMRIRATGGKIHQDPTIVSTYSPRSSLSGLFRQYFQFGFWRVAVLRKHPRNASWRHFVPAAALATFVAVITLSRQTAILLLAAYALLSLYASLRAAKREGWDLLPALPVTFAVYQGAYAVGFFAGLLYWFTRNGRARQNTR